jgi:hypothetical protein
MAAGCSADVAPGDSAEIGSTAQALSTGGAMFPAFINLDANNVLIAGGFDPTTGSATSGVFKYNVGTGLYTALDTLNTARGAAEIVAIPGTDKLLIAGGSASYQNGAALSSAEIYDISDDAWTTVAGSTGLSANMNAARTFFGLQVCGTGSGDGSAKIIAIGGITTGTSTATAKMDVLTFKAGNNGADSGWTGLDDANSANALDLATARGFHKVVPLSSTSFLAIGGLNAGGVLGSTELVTTDNSCLNATKANKAALPTISSVAQHRAKFAAAKIDETVSHSPTNKHFVAFIAGGTHDNTDFPTATFRYDEANDAWEQTSNSLTTGRMYPTISPGATAGTFEIRAGQSSASAVSDRRDVYTPSSDSWTTLNADFGTPRYGNWQALLNGTVKCGAGADAVVDVGGSTFANEVTSVQ